MVAFHPVPHLLHLMAASFVLESAREDRIGNELLIGFGSDGGIHGTHSGSVGHELVLGSSRDVHRVQKLGAEFAVHFAHLALIARQVHVASTGVVAPVMSRHHRVVTTAASVVVVVVVATAAAFRGAGSCVVRIPSLLLLLLLRHVAEAEPPCG